MTWPWSTPAPKAPAQPDPTVVERARRAREAAERLIVFYLPEIDPNDILSEPPAPGHKEPAWSA